MQAMQAPAPAAALVPRRMHKRPHTFTVPVDRPLWGPGAFANIACTHGSGRAARALTAMAASVTNPAPHTAFESSSYQPFAPPLTAGYIRRVYEGELLSHVSPRLSASEALAVRDHINQCQTVDQLQRLVQDASPSLPPPLLGACLAKVFNLYDPQRQSASASANPTAETSGSTAHEVTHQPLSKDSNADVQGSQSNSDVDFRGQCRHLVLSLCQQLAAHCQPTAPGAVSVAQASLAVAAAAKVYGSIRQQPSGAGQQLHDALTQVLYATRPGLLLLSTSELGRLSLGLCHLELTLDPHWTLQFLKVCQARMAQLSGPRLSTVARAAANLLRHGPSPSHITSGASTPAAAQLLSRRQPDGYWVLSLLEATQPVLATLTGTQLTNLLWAVTQWDLDPGAEWRAAAFTALRRHVQSMRSDSLGATLAAVLSLHAHNPQGPVPSALLAACTERVLELKDELEPKHDCQVLHAWAHLRHLPPESDMQSLLSAIQQRLPRYSITQLAWLAQVLARVQFLPSTEWLWAWSSALQTGLRSADTLQCSLVLSACAMWRVVPPRPLLLDMMTIVQSSAQGGRICFEQAAHMLLALSALGLPMSKQLLHSVLMVIANAPHAPVLGSSSTSQQQRATARLLGRAFTKLPVLLALYSREQLQPSQVAVVVADDRRTANSHVTHTALTHSGDNGAAHISPAGMSHGAGINGSAPVQSRATPVSSRQPVDGGSPQSRSDSVSPLLGGNVAAWKPPAVGHLTPRPARPMLPANEVAQEREQDMVTRRHRCAQVVDILLPPAVAAPLLEAIRVRLHLMPSRELFLLVRTLALLRLSPGPEWLAAHVAAVKPHMKTMTAQQKWRLNTAYRFLASDPSCLRLSSVNKQR